jgi:cytochrome c556
MMIDAGKAAVAAIDAKDLDKLQLDVAEQILNSCSTCHDKYMKQ